MIEEKSKVEKVKIASRQLRGTLAESLQDELTHFGADDTQLLKFHGLYQQDDRDHRGSEARRRLGRAWLFMIRSKIPGGVLTAEQYLVHDRLATVHGNGTLRITTRQDFQLHGVVRGDLVRTLREIDAALVTTFGACGDVVRNVTCCPVPRATRLRTETIRLAQRITERFMPKTRAYHEIWLDGEKVEGDVEEPIYGRAYLPRKFKIGIAHPGDNCVDIFTHDLGLVPLEAHGGLVGYNVLVGGGQGMTHNKPETFPRLADVMAYVAPEEALDVVEQIVAVQRDHGDRADRRHARMKYLIHDRGLDWFKGEVERRLGRRLAPPVAMPSFELKLHLGWHRQAKGTSFLGIHVENGRIRDTRARRYLTGLREIVRRLNTNVVLTPTQDLLLTGIDDARRAEVEALLDAHRIPRDRALSNARVHAMACPALPTCGLALAEAERALPALIDELEVELARLGLGDEKFTVRMTGCPNGCARPYVADLAFVGRSLDKYVVLVGGAADGTRLNRVYQDLVPRHALVATTLPLFEFFKASRSAGESFGAFCDRVGVDALHAYAAQREKKVAHG